MDWQLPDAEHRLDELITLATTEGPQTIHRDHDAVVVVSESTFREMAKRPPTLKDMILNGPSLEGVVPARDRSPMRDVDL